MKIVVLAGGLSTERQVALTSGTGVCRALRERGHRFPRQNFPDRIFLK